MDQSTLKYYSDNAAQVAERYESVVSNLSAHFVDSFSKGGKILDIGCGSGRDLAVLHKLGFDCYGVDPTPEFVAIGPDKKVRPAPKFRGNIMAVET